MRNLTPALAVSISILFASNALAADLLQVFRDATANDATYTSAATDWPVVQGITSCEQNASDWVDALAAGLRLYGIDEGWDTP